jgi:hypothetical protein
LKFGETLPLAGIEKPIRTVNVLVATYGTFRNLISDPPGPCDENPYAGDPLLMTLGIGMFWFGSAAEKLFRETSRPVRSARSRRAPRFRTHFSRSPTVFEAFRNRR